MFMHVTFAGLLPWKAVYYQRLKSIDIIAACIASWYMCYAITIIITINVHDSVDSNTKQSATMLSNLHQDSAQRIEK